MTLAGGDINLFEKIGTISIEKWLYLHKYRNRKPTKSIESEG